MNSQTIRRIALVFTIGCILVHPPAHLSAQSTFDMVRGSALDQTGAAVPGAAITLHNVDENSNLMVISDNSGNFSFENLKPGHYTVTAVKEGFARASVSQLELTARQTLRVDVTLSIAAQAETVEVKASAAAVNTENATLSDSKGNNDITQLPINSRACRAALWRLWPYLPR